MMTLSVTHRRRRRSKGGWSRRGWRSCCFDPWLLRSKLGLASLNRHRANGTHDGEVRRLGIRSRMVANDPHDNKRKDKLIMGCRISIDIDERERMK